MCEVGIKKAKSYEYISKTYFLSNNTLKISHKKNLEKHS